MEKAVPAESRYYCPNPHCSRVIGRRGTSRRVTCPTCKAVVRLQLCCALLPGLACGMCGGKGRLSGALQRFLTATQLKAGTAFSGYPGLLFSQCRQQWDGSPFAHQAQCCATTQLLVAMPSAPALMRDLYLSMLSPHWPALPDQGEAHSDHFKSSR